MFRQRILLLLVTVLLSSLNPCQAIAIAGYRPHYDDSDQKRLRPDKNSTDEFYGFRFARFQSRQEIQHAIHAYGKKNTRRFQWFQGKDGRRGWVSSIKLAGDWVLAESRQTAVECTPRDVLETYLSGALQQQWNAHQILECRFRRILFNGVASYRQDLVLKSQRVLRSHTGIMKYSQLLTIDQIGKDQFNVWVRLLKDDNDRGNDSASSRLKPFDALQVHVSVQPNGTNTEIYVAGIMKVNRRVVPNLVVFDASGIAGSMAGKGTLWLAGHFEQQRQRRQQALQAAAAAKSSSSSSKFRTIPLSWSRLYPWKNRVPISSLG